MTPTKNITSKAVELQDLIIQKVATTEEVNGEDYLIRRSLLIGERSIKGVLPDFILKCRTLEQLNQQIKSKFKTYAERRNFVWEGFTPLLDFLETSDSSSIPIVTKNKVFISYSVKDKAIAGEIKNLLKRANLSAFLAHEDIEVSQEWAEKILDEINSSEIFICLLNENFKNSDYCIQETGIAASKRNMCVIPLSLDGTIPPGFLGKIQSSKINTAYIQLTDLIPAFLSYKHDLGVSIILDCLSSSGSYRSAENYFTLLKPVVKELNIEQSRKLIQICTENSQVYDSVGCAQELLPRVVEYYSELMTVEEHRFITKQINRYVNN
jgi:hypothetical protein